MKTCSSCSKNKELNQFYEHFKTLDKRQSRCISCTKFFAKKTYNDVRKPYRKFLKDKCEECGFIPQKTCQLDIHHIDNNHFNNEINNLVTLCANCHRIK